MKINPSVLIIDTSSLGYAAMYQPAFSKLKSGGMSISALHGLPMSVYKLMRIYPDATPVLLWDGSAQWRKDIYPGYKGDRDSTPEKIAIRASYREQVPFLIKIFSYLGLPCISHNETEADDLAGLICRSLPKTETIVMGTHDGDWMQALDENVFWHNTYNDELISLDKMKSPDFKDGNFLSTEEFVSAKSIAGDVSDCIDGVYGIGLKTATNYMRKYGGSMEAVWDAFDSNDFDMNGVKIKAICTDEAREIYARNRVLMDWRLSVLPMDITVNTPQVDVDSASEIMNKFGLREVNRFTKAEMIDVIDGRMHQWEKMTAKIRYSIDPLFRRE
jgi:DNA polymerase-1